ncbi:MAG: transposase, partial [Bacillota bacterium]|nr:transposase [Bacillota bacterium]
MKTKRRCTDGIEGVAMDMSRGYCNGVLETLPNAKPVIDRFHV